MRFGAFRRPACARRLGWRVTFVGGGLRVGLGFGRLTLDVRAGGAMVSLLGHIRDLGHAVDPRLRPKSRRCRSRWHLVGELDEHRPAQRVPATRVLPKTSRRPAAHATTVASRSAPAPHPPQGRPPTNGATSRDPPRRRTSSRLGPTRARPARRERPLQRVPSLLRRCTTGDGRARGQTRPRTARQAWLYPGTEGSAIHTSTPRACCALCQRFA
jgi:hypothetical protein